MAGAPVRRIQRAATAGYDSRAWPYALPPVAQLLRDGLDLAPGVTFLVGENGSGKSTLVEAIALAAGLDPLGGSRQVRREDGESVDGTLLHQALQLIRSPGAARWGFFLRAETMHGLSGYLLEAGAPLPNLLTMSHGESFVTMLDKYFDGPGFYLLDEPESALSFTSSLALLRVLDEVRTAGGQVLCATHSPVLAALPGATILELDGEGFHPAAWDELNLVRDWKAYLDDPGSYLRYVLGD